MKYQILESPSIEALYHKERYLLKRITSVLFAIAGCSWFLLYVPESIIHQKTHELFKLQQYQIYVLLLTLWGLDYKRQLDRLTVLSQKASLLQKAVIDIQSSDIPEEIQKFEVLWFKKNTHGKHISWVITWIFLLFACVLITRQYILIFNQNI